MGTANRMPQAPQLTLDIEVPDVVPLEAPSAPIPTLINTESGLRRAAVKQLAAASGPVAVDTERAQGIAAVRVLFLVQLKREDQLYLQLIPRHRICIINDALADAEWVIHATGGTSKPGYARY